MKKLLTVLFLIQFINLYSFAQVNQASVSLADLTIPENQATVDMPLTVTNFNDIGSISLKIQFDPAALSFISIKNSPINFTANASNGVLILSWFATDPVNKTDILNFGDGKLLDISFAHASGMSSNLTFLSAGFDAISNSNGQAIQTQYTPGSITILPPPPPSFAGTVKGKIWIDENKDGIRNETPVTGLKDVTVELFKKNGSNSVWLGWKITDVNGEYIFSKDNLNNDLTEGEYFVKVTLKDANNVYRFSPSKQGTDGNLDSDVETIVNDTTGRSSIVTINSGNSIAQLDGGVYDGSVTPPPPSFAGTVKGKIWIDENKDGIQNETPVTGLKDVTVELFKKNGSNSVWLGWKITDVNGEYIFSKDNLNNDLTEGEYFVKVTLKDANNVYRFSPSKQGTDGNLDSDVETIVNDTTGRSSIVTINSGNSIAQLDGGVYENVVLPPGPKPVLAISIYDGILVAPPKDQVYSYTIKFKNEGSGYLFDASIIDTIPQGLKYVSSSGGNSSFEISPNVVKFDLGTIAAMTEDSVSLTVMVTNTESDYENTACLFGVDSDNNSYTVCAYDMNLHDNTTPGDESGVESKGDMAELLLLRQWKKTYGFTTPIISNNKVGRISAAFKLDNFIPTEGPFSSQAVEDTPFDILGISNATSSYAVNYVLPQDNNRRVGGIFSTITPAPNIYDHTKAICDRLADYNLEDLRLLNINGYNFYAAKLRSRNKNYTDYSVSFSVYETNSEFQIENKWTYEEYISPSNTVNVYNFQVWSSSYKETVNLVKNIINKLTSVKPVIYLNTTQIKPEVFIIKSNYSHDGKIHLVIKNNGSAVTVNIKTKYRISQGDNQLENSQAYNLQTGENIITIDQGIISDANIYLTTPNGFNDDVFVSGGAFTYVTGQQSKVNQFVTTGFSQPDPSNFTRNTLLLAGGISAQGELKDWVSFIRSLRADGSAYNLSAYSKIRFEAKGTGTVTVIFDMENTQNFNYYAYNIELSNSYKEYIIDFNDFKELLGPSVAFQSDKIKTVGFVFNTANNSNLNNFSIDIKNIGFLPSSVTAVNDNSDLPREFSLSQNYPNPFNPSTVIRFSLPQTSRVTLTVYNILGQRVATLIDGEVQAGIHNINFNANNLASGVYIYRLSGDNINFTKKMVLTK